MKLRKTPLPLGMSGGNPRMSCGFQPNPLHRWWRRQKMTTSKRTVCDGETEGSGGAQVPSGGSRTSSRLGAETPTRSGHSLGSGSSAETPLVRRRLIRALLTRKDSGGSPLHRISEISSVARRTLRSVWPDRGALPEVRGRADRVGSLADGHGDRTGPLAPPGAGRRFRSAETGDVPGPAGQGETPHRESPSGFHRSRVMEHDDHVDLGAPRS